MSNLINYFVNINSKDRLNYNNTTSSDISINIQDIISLNSRRNPIYITPVYFAIPPTWYNITSVNNKVTFIEDTIPSTSPTPLTITIPPGQYNIVTFQNALTDAMIAASLASGYVFTYSSSYNDATGQLTVSQPVSVNTLFTFSFGDWGTDLAPFLGFNKSYENTTVVNLNNYFVLSPVPVNFTETIPAIYIRSNLYKLASGYDTSEGQQTGGSSDILAIIPIYGNGFSQVVFENYEGISDRRIEVSNPVNQSITLKLTSDDSNFLIDLGGFDFTCTLLIQYYR